MRTMLLLAAALLFAPRILSHPGPHDVAEDMAVAARRFLNALDAGQTSKAVYELDSEERFNWHFIPKDRKGLPVKEMTAAQLPLAQALLTSALSHRGMMKAGTIMSLEAILQDLEQGRGPRRDAGLYFFTVFGEPRARGTWGWRVEGHHLSLNFTVAGTNGVSVTPTFMGSNPGEVRSGPRQGLRALAGEEDLARELVKSLDDTQRTTAVISDTAPADIITGAERRARLLTPAGLPASKMTDAQAALLDRLIREYVDRYRPELADRDWEKIQKAGRANIHFAWAGGFEPNQGHYYRIQGPTFLMEYDNTQNNANHVHTAWRDLENDFGEDLLRRHYEQFPHPTPRPSGAASAQ